MTWDDLLRTIGGLLAPFGGSWAQGDVGADGGGPSDVGFCCAHDLLADALPHIPQITDVSGNEGGCVDLWLTGEGDHLLAAHFEGFSPGESLARLGLLAEARRYAASAPGPVDLAGPALVRALTLILTPDDLRGVEDAPYRVVGDGDPLVVLPGGPVRDGHYLGDLGGLAASRRLVVPVFPHTRVEDLVPVVEAVRNDLGLSRIDVLAHSAGAVLALAYLAAHPDRVARLVLMSPAVRAMGIADDVDGAARIVRARRAEPGFEESRKVRWLEGATYPEELRLTYGRWDDQVAALAGTGSVDQGERLAAYYAAPRPDPGRLRAAATAFPGDVTVMTGRLDVGPTPRQADELATLFPRGRVVEIEGAAHYPWLDAPEEVCRAVLSGLTP
ncbi:alpha/beta fold hydrolase [Serinicoccus marinus]|uniref:alpha/beta fold hydrolase n=1 Tax=Serinicoccus marinus TaxID=247333 RepID=UPI0024938CEB|nr:alpha/beta hydrolase [Serinicoccus marinus]